MINLLPPEEKRELLSEKKKRIIVILWILVLLSLFSLILILVSARIFLETQVLSQKGLLLEVERGSNQPEMRDFQEKISLINQNLTKLKNFYKEKIYFPDILERVSKTLPQQLYLTNFSAALSLSGEEPIVKVSLSGFAPSREILFEFKQALEKESGFKNVYFSPANWVKPTDIDFLVTFNLDIR